jgi:hypothetical protein
MTKQSVKDQRAQTKFNDDIRRMNEAAMKSYMRDIEGTGDISTQAINDQLKASQSSLAFTPTVDPMLPPPGVLSDNESTEAGGSGSNKAKKKKPNAANPNKGDSMWVEALSEDGDTYYWNVKTNGKWPNCELGIIFPVISMFVSRLIFAGQCFWFLFDGMQTLLSQPSNQFRIVTIIMSNCSQFLFVEAF